MQPQGLPHQAALNVWDEEEQESRVAPEWDYTTLIVTVAMEHDAHLYARWGGGGNAGIHRRKIIRVPGATAWYIAPGTVLDIDGNTLVQSAGGWLRDDSTVLRRIGFYASLWYQYSRPTVSLQIEGVAGQFGIGQLWFPPRGDMPAPVTSIGVRWQGGTAQTDIAMGYGEVDWGSMANV